MGLGPKTNNNIQISPNKTKIKKNISKYTNKQKHSQVILTLINLHANLINVKPTLILIKILPNETYFTNQI